MNLFFSGLFPKNRWGRNAKQNPERAFDMNSKSYISPFETHIFSNHVDMKVMFNFLTDICNNGFVFRQEGVAIFDARQLSNDVFTITSGQLQPTETPVRIILKPPSYDEATIALGELGRVGRMSVGVCRGRDRDSSKNHAQTSEL